MCARARTHACGWSSCLGPVKLMWGLPWETFSVPGALGDSQGSTLKGQAPSLF